MWNVGCLEDFLRLGQHGTSLGIWVWLTIWVWWGVGLISRKTQAYDTISGSFKVTSMAKRVIAGFGLLPFIFGGYFIIAVFLIDVMDEIWAIIATNVFSGAVAVSIWLLIWYRVVLWTPRVVVYTVVSILIGMTVVALCPLLVNSTARLQVVAYWLPLMTLGVWVATTAWLWPARTSPVSLLEEQLRCLRCDYSLVGLTHTRCPECGNESTLEQLFRESINVDIN